MSAALISVTPDAESTMAYIARVSSPNQENPEYARLLKYCIDHQHWSVFEHAFMTVEIGTSRMISAQILRHRSFTFSEFSQRYAEPMEFVSYSARRQAEKNRQSSIDDLPAEDQLWWDKKQREHWYLALDDYQTAIAKGIAKECARSILPMNTRTRIYMTGSVRSWIHYIQLRTQPDTQQEHREIAERCKKIFKAEFPVVSTALGW
jgi:thymidylate synthase (FAD)